VGIAAEAPPQATGVVANGRSPHRRGETFSSLRHQDYRYLWAGTLFMSLGQWIQQITLGFLVYDLTSSSVLLGTLQALRALPFLLVSPFAGVAVDRLDRRKLLIAVQSILAVTALTMGMLVGSGLVQVWHVFVFAAITAVVWAVNQPLRQTLVNKVVPKEDLSNAVALNSVAFNVTKVIGPAVGGWLISLFGTGGNFLVQGCAYIAVLASVWRMNVPPVERREGKQESVWENLVGGLSYARRSPALFALLIAGLVPSVIATPYQTLMPVVQKDVLGVGPEVLGLMYAAPGVGAVAFTLALASVSNRIRHKGYVLLGAMGAMGLSLIAFSHAGTVPLTLVALTAVGGFQILYAATNTTMVQLIVPDEYLGRIMSIYMVSFGFSPAGSLFAGLGAQYFGAPATLAIMGTLVAGMAVVMAIFNPEMRRIET
jgi:MFS family permease